MAQVAKHEHALSLGAFARILGRVERPDAAGVGRQHQHRQRTRLARSARADFLLGRRDERPDQALVGHGRPVDLLGIGDEGLRILLRRDRGPA